LVNLFGVVNFGNCFHPKFLGKSQGQIGGWLYCRELSFKKGVGGDLNFSRVIGEFFKAPFGRGNKPFKQPLGLRLRGV